ncbi:hypothetical protein JHK85_043287 [Glycine max]|nr:hypothetical protein JHK85_043287 [Glycine max]
MLSFLISALIILFFPTFLNVNKEDYELDLLLNLYAPIPLLEDADEDEDEDEGGEQHNDQVAEVTNVEQHKDNWFEQEIYYKVIWCLALDSVASEFQNLTILSTKRFGKDHKVHRDEIHGKLVQIMRQRLLVQLRGLPQIVESCNRPEDADPQPSQLLGPIQRCVLLSLSLPVLYDRYQNQVDDRLGNLSIEWSNAHDSIVLNSYLQKTFGLTLSTTTKAMA